MTAAAQCGGDGVRCLIAGTTPVKPPAAAAIAGVAKVIHADAPGFERRPGRTSQRGWYHRRRLRPTSCSPATASGRNVAPRVAATHAGRGPALPTSKVISADTFERPIYANNAIATVQSTDAETRRHGARPASIRQRPRVKLYSSGSRHGCGATARGRFKGSGLRRTTARTTAAKIIVSGGRALGSGEGSTSHDAAGRQAGRGHRRGNRPAVDWATHRTTTKSARPARSWRHGWPHRGGHLVPFNAAGMEGIPR